MVGHVVGREQHGVIARGVQRAVRAVDDPRFGQHGAAFTPEVVDHELVMRGRVRCGLRLSGGRRERENGKNTGGGKAYSHRSSWILLPARSAGTRMQYRESNVAFMPVRLIACAAFLATATLAAAGCRSDSAAQQQ